MVEILVAILFVVSSRWWGPALYEIVRDLWTTSHTDEHTERTSALVSEVLGSHERAPSALHTERATVERGSPAWSRRRLQNPSWETGRGAREQRARQGFKRRDRSTATSLGRAHWQGGFGRKGT